MYIDGTVALAVIIGLVTIVTAIPKMKSKGLFDFSPLVGCGILMLGAIAILLLLLVKAWGWV